MPNFDHDVTHRATIGSRSLQSYPWHYRSRKIADTRADYDFSTRAGYQLAMKNALINTSSAETKAYAEAMVVPSFYHIINGERHQYDEWFASLETWGGKITDYEPVV
jgi:hypothetical protein